MTRTRPTVVMTRWAREELPDYQFQELQSRVPAGMTLDLGGKSPNGPWLAAVWAEGHAGRLVEPVVRRDLYAAAMAALEMASERRAA